LLKDYAKTTPSPSGTDLKVKPMFGGRFAQRNDSLRIVLVLYKL